MSRQLPRLLQSGRPSLSFGSRCFSSTLLRAQQLPGEDARTTHFGFETVAEAQKEARGMVTGSRRIGVRLTCTPQSEQSFPQLHLPTIP